MFPAQTIESDFDTLLLDNLSDSSIESRISIEDATDYDEEIGPNGEIDIGEIASQYLSMEL